MRLHSAPSIGHANHYAYTGRGYHHGFTFHAPTSTCNSATNPEKPGSPMEAIPAITNAPRGEGHSPRQMHRLEFRQLPRMGALIDDAAHDSEEQARQYAVREHLHDRAGYADLV